jgi:two-component system response regulator (stage 0 sporulation protein A)
MLKKKIYFLQESKEANEELVCLFEQSGNFEVVGYSTDGISAITQIIDRKPDVLITGLVVKGYDGMLVISKLREAGMKLKIIVLSALTSEEVMASATTAGANYFMAKPFDGQVLLQRTLEIVEDKDKLKRKPETSGFHTISLEEKISKIFINVGIPPHIKGYSFLREGVKMAVEEPDIINNITKKLYPSIGEKYQTTASKVERAIRHAIEVAWNRGRIDNINNILGVRAFMGSEKPTNGEFIALVADKMLLEKA